jgi:outer membrane receptor protein involved in Fe transport
MDPSMVGRPIHPNSDKQGVMPASKRPLRVLIAGLLASGTAIAADPPAGAPSSASAATSPASAPAAAPVVTEIVVTGSRPAVENRVDRKIYAVSGDLQADIGSAADVLRNVPSVSLDIDGNPSLRGDSGVQILVDGRYRPEFNGANRGAALEQLAANGIERIEVMTNPTARYKREGSSGIINIITKRAQGAHTASAQASLGSGDRYRVDVRQGAQLGALNVRGSADVRADRRIRDIESHRTVRDESGAVLHTRDQRSHGDDDRLAKKISLGADYDLGAIDRLSAEGSYYRRDTHSALTEDMLRADAAGAPISHYERVRRADEYEYSSDALLRYRRGGKNDDEFSVALERSEELEHRPLRSTYLPSLPPGPATYVDQLWIEDAVTTELSVDRASSGLGGRKFTAGYDLQRDDNSLDGAQTLPAGDGDPRLPDPAFTNVFHHEQTIHAVYATVEQPLGSWTILAGLRLEQAHLDLQTPGGERSSQDYFRAYPSLHLARQLDEARMLTFSYARRVERPYWQAMNPHRLQFEANQFEAGNPDLRPSIIDSLEAGWSRDTGASSLAASIYWRRKRDSLTYVTTLISPTATLNTTQNLGEDRSGGVELAASGKIGTRLGYNLSANL